MRPRSVNACKPCQNREYPLWTQLLLSFLSLTVLSLLLALGDVVTTTLVVGNHAMEIARQTMEDQIERHLKDASTEAAATIGEKFRRLKNGVLDVTAFALRDTLQEDIILAGGSEGYPLSPSHADLRDTEIATSMEATLDDFHRQNIPVDLSRSVWHYANETSFTATVSAEDMSTIGQTARLDLLWPTMYNNSKNTKAVFVGVPLPSSTWPAFRYFPGGHLSGDSKTSFACNGGDEKDTCFDASERPWYKPSVAKGISTGNKLGGVIATSPYIGASGSEGNWLVTIARAVYGDTGSTLKLLGVVGVDVLLEAVQVLVEEITFLQSGYSILATAEEGVILASPARVWDRVGTEYNTTVCASANGMCLDGRRWEDLLSGEVVEFESTSFSDDGLKKKAILIAAPVSFSLDSDTGDAAITHYIISAVAREEIFSEADRMSTLIWKSTQNVGFVTVSVAAATVIAVAAAVYAISGSITGAISKMASAARSIAGDGAKTNVFGSVASTWTGARNGGATSDGSTAGGDFSSSRKQQAVDYLLCRGEDEISVLAHEFSLMITGLGKGGSAARATGLEDSIIFLKNPFVKP